MLDGVNAKVIVEDATGQLATTGPNVTFVSEGSGIGHLKPRTKTGENARREPGLWRERPLAGMTGGDKSSIRLKTFDILYQ